MEKLTHRSYANLRIKFVIFEIRGLAFSIGADVLTQEVKNVSHFFNVPDNIIIHTQWFEAKYEQNYMNSI